MSVSTPAKPEMEERIFQLDDDAKLRAAEVQSIISSKTLRAFESAQESWANVGLAKDEVDELTKTFVDHMKSTADQFCRAANRRREEAVEHNEYLGREIDELYAELGIDGNIDHLNIQSDDTILALKKKLEKEFERLLALKDKMLEGIRALKQREEVLCAELGAQPLDICSERVPTEQDIREMESNIKMLESEKSNRKRVLAEAGDKAVDYWSQLGEDPCGTFEKDLRDGRLALTKGNIANAQKLVETLDAKVAERSESFQMRKQEIELLWSRLDYSNFHVQMFRDKYFGIKADQFTAMDAELAKLRQEKQEKLGQFIENIREEIRGLGEKLMFGPETQDRELQPYLCEEEASQDVLDRLEGLANRMRMDLDSKATLLRKVVKWQALIGDYHRVEAEQTDPSRLKNRGGGLLKLSQEAAKLKKLIPDLFGKLRQEVLDWEIANEIEFKVRDVRFVEAMEADFSDTNLGAKPRVPIGGGISTGKRKQQQPALPPSMSSSKLMKNNDGTRVINPGALLHAPVPDSTLESVPDFNAFRIGIDSASKAAQQRRRSPRLAHRLKNPGLKALAAPSAGIRPGVMLRHATSPMTSNASRAPLNEISPVLNHLTSTQVESPSKRNFFPRRV